MGPLTLLLRLPFLPLKAVIHVAELIQEQVEREVYDPASVRRQLEEAQRQRAAGNISEEEMRRIEQEATSRLVTPQQPAGALPETTGGEDDG
ncbi:MAG TPA: gas vesicle protein GvpG [Trebonia sp.]|jgi:cytochrome c-type biogenesis protein CcmH/NrfG